MNNNNTNLAKNLWIEWQLFKKNESTNPTLQMKKQGIMSKTDQYAEFTYRPNASSPPSMQEFYESVINGIIKRFQLGLYQGEYPYYNELQSCLHEFIRLMNFKSEILVEVFQSITNLNLSKETFPNVVVPCASCGMFIYIVKHCTNCYSAFYCDQTCLKNGKQKHETECQQAKITPSIIYPLQVEIHCGGSLGDDVRIYFQHERKLSLLYRGQKFLNSMYKILLKNRWLKNNGYNIIENETSIQLQSTKKIDMKPTEDLGDPNFSDEDLYLKMPCVQEIKVIFLNQGYNKRDIQFTYKFYSYILFSYMKVNKNLQDAIIHLNSLSIPRTEIVIGRIFSKPGQSYKDLFTTEEIAKFQQNLNISEQQLANIVNAFTFVLMHVVAERNLSQVEDILAQNKMSLDHIEVFRQQWIQYGNEYSIRIREKPVAVQHVLHSLHWKIGLQVDESRLPQKNVANFMNVDGKIDDANDLYSYDARNPLTTFVFETQPSGEQNQFDKFSIQFQKAQMQELFEQLESIQESLDKLN